MTEVPFNVNQTVKVKLNQKGLDELERQHTELYRRVGQPRPWTPPKTDEDGYSRWQLWTLMEQLGHLCQIGREPPFATEIILLTGT